MNLFHTEFTRIFKKLLFWTLTILPLAFVIGSLVAFFLWLLDWVTATRWQNMGLIFLLPLAGLGIYFLYRFFGKDAEAGNNLIIDEIHEPGGGVPARMAPLVLLSTVITHLFGGSAGREGTAVQMGGSVAALFAQWYRVSKEDRSILLMAGMAAGFGAVFGTPVAGAVFALEVLFIGRIRYQALVPCLMASLLADITCRAYGIYHTDYSVVIQSLNISTRVAGVFMSINFTLLLKVIVAAIIFGLIARSFARLTHGMQVFWKRHISIPWLIPVLGGCLVVALSYILGNFNYLGLGVDNPDHRNSILAAFTVHGVDSWSWFWKLLFTALTLSVGFKGGEVTPLFFVGATLGNSLAILMGAPVDLFAALGFMAVFAGATNTPIACMIMGIELFGADYMIYFAVACFTAYYFSGHHGIYSSQKWAVSKFNKK